MSGLGMVWWITGLSGAGKSTVAALVQRGLSDRGVPALMLDGDRLRAVLGQTAHHTREERLRLAETYGRLALEVASQGIDAVCATVSMFQPVRDWNRCNIPHYREVYLRVPVTELERRDPHDIYARARANLLTNVVGIDLPLDEPASPDLVIDNYGDMLPDATCARILALDPRP